MRLYPHARLAEDSTEWGSWVVLHEGAEVPLGEKLAGWDYTQALELELRPRVDLAALSAAGLTVVEDALIVATADCRETGARFVATSPVVGGSQLKEVESPYEDWRQFASGEDTFFLGYWEEGRAWAITDHVDVVLQEAQSELDAEEALRRLHEQRALGEVDFAVRVEVPAGSVAVSVALQCHIIVGVERPAGPPKGARLAESRLTTVMLEGEGGRFPTEPVSFSQAGLTGGPWHLDVRFDELDEAFMGAVRLFVNTDMDAGVALLDPDHPRHPLLQQVLRWDLVRTLLWAVASQTDPALVPRTFEDERAVGAVLDALCRGIWQLNLAEVITAVQQDSAGFERRLRTDLLTLPRTVLT